MKGDAGLPSRFGRQCWLRIQHFQRRGASASPDIGCGGRIRTAVLQGMNLASYRLLLADFELLGQVAPFDGSFIPLAVTRHD